MDLRGGEGGCSFAEACGELFSSVAGFLFRVEDGFVREEVDWARLAELEDATDWSTADWPGGWPAEEEAWVAAAAWRADERVILEDMSV